MIKSNDEWKRIHLQWFADEPEPDDGKDKDKDTPPADDGEGSVNLDLNTIQKYLDDKKEDREKLFNKYFQPDLDRKVTQAIETFKSNHLEVEIEKAKAEVRKEYDKDDDPMVKRIQALEKEKLQEKQERQRLEIENLISNHANSLGLKLGDRIKAIAKMGDEQAGRAFLEWLKEYGESEFNKGKTQFIKENKHTPLAGDDGERIWTEAELKNLTPDEYRKHEKSILASLERQGKK